MNHKKVHKVYSIKNEFHLQEHCYENKKAKNWKNILKSMNLTNDLYLGHIKQFYNSTIKKFKNGQNLNR